MTQEQTEADHITMVARGYDAIIDAYHANYRDSVPGIVEQIVSDFDELMPNGAEILELGCGSGIPFTAQLAERHSVTGIDVSKNQIEAARRNVPSGKFLVQDMTEVDLPSDSFDGVLALYSIIHVPRQRHEALFRSIFDWLKPGGIFMASLGSSDSEEWIDNNWLGAPMYWSHFAPDVSRKLIEQAGFTIEIDRIEELINPADGETERHFWVTARKPN